MVRRFKPKVKEVIRIPIPKPRKSESRDKYISRCMSNNIMEKEFPDNNQRTAVCFSTWRKYGSVGERGGDRGGPRKRPLRPVHVKGHYRHINGIRTWVKAHLRR